MHLQYWAVAINPLFLKLSGILLPNTTYHSALPVSYKAFQRAKSRRMAQDLAHVLGCHHNPDSSAYYSNNNSFNTTGSLNYNTDSLNNNKHCFNTNNTNITVTDDRSEILTWLSPLEPRLRHSDIGSRRVGNVGDWLLQTEEFRSWKSGDGESSSQKATIFCSGNPGVGKTYMR